MKEELHSILGREATFEGKFVFEGTVRIDGKVKGEIASEGVLIVGEDGEIEGKAEIGVLILHGKFKGECRAAEKVELRAGSNFNGDIITSKLIIEDGAVFNGTCSMDEKEGDVSRET